MRTTHRKQGNRHCSKITRSSCRAARGPAPVNCAIGMDISTLFGALWCGCFRRTLTFEHPPNASMLRLTSLALLLSPAAGAGLLISRK